MDVKIAEVSKNGQAPKLAELLRAGMLRSVYHGHRLLRPAAKCTQRIQFVI